MADQENTALSEALVHGLKARGKDAAEAAALAAVHLTRARAVLRVRVEEALAALAPDANQNEREAAVAAATSEALAEIDSQALQIVTK